MVVGRPGSIRNESMTIVSLAARRMLSGLSVLILIASCGPAPTSNPTSSPTLSVTRHTTETSAPSRTPNVIAISPVLPTESSTPLPIATVRSTTGSSVPTFTPIPAFTPTRARSPTPTLTRSPSATRLPTLAPSPPLPTSPPVARSELISIPEGLVRLGTPRGEQGDPDEKPQHDVRVYAFQIERFEVTNAQYQACVAARACPSPLRANSYTRPSYFGNPSFYGFPVVNVTWDMAAAYCRWIGRRLPNEAEWERAGRGADNWRYTYTNILGMQFEWNAIYHGSPLSFCEANCPFSSFWRDVNDGWADTAPVGSFSYDSSKGFGVMDMAGNVREWTSNWYDPNAYTDGNDISGPNSPTGTRVVRGGSWADEPRRLADRDSLAPNEANDRTGFRCAQ